MNIVERMNHYHVPGVSVCYFDEGAVRWSRCFGVRACEGAKPVDGNTIFHACSISKMVTALCALRLVQEGKLALDGDVNAHLRTWKLPKEHGVSLRNLLSHQAGFIDPEGSFEPYRIGDPVPKPADLLRGTTLYHPQPLGQKYAPETRFEYADAGYCLVAQLLEDVTGESVPRLAERLIFRPLGLQRTFFWEIGAQPDFIADCAFGHDSSGAVVAGGRAHYPNVEGAGLWTTPTELSAIALDLMAAYHHGGGVILGQDLALQMFTPGGDGGFACPGLFYDGAGDFFFSQGWGVGMQCKMRLYPRTGRGIAVMTNSEPGMEQDRALVGEIIAAVCDLSGHCGLDSQSSQSSRTWGGVEILGQARDDRGERSERPEK